MSYRMCPSSCAPRPLLEGGLVGVGGPGIATVCRKPRRWGVVPSGPCPALLVMIGMERDHGQHCHPL